MDDPGPPGRARHHPLAHDGTNSGAASQPDTVVPPPGVDEMPTSPPNVASRSRMFWSPVPAEVTVVSKPTPSSRTRNAIPSPCRVSSTRTSEAFAYFAAFCIASRQTK